METKSKKMKQYIILLFSVLLFISCEEEFIPDFANEEPTVVVEGYIQAGEQASPIVVTLSKTYPLFQNSDNIKGPELYLGGATMKVEGNGQSIILTEVCTESLDPEIKELLISTLGLDSAFFEVDICFYSDINNEINAEVGEKYQLTIDFEGEQLTAETSIPEYIPIDSFNIFDPLNNSMFRQLNGYLNDPLNPNYYRIKIGLNGGALRNTFSVTDDLLFDGQSFEFPINKQPDPSETDLDPTIVGLYSIGDSLLIQWQTIDEGHFDFWNTLEFARGNQGPFASYTRAATNINGGIGVWGGSSIGYYNVAIE